MNWIVEAGAALDNGYFRRNILITEDKVNKFRFQHGNMDVYITTWKYDSAIQKDAKIIGDLYFDFDSNNLEEVRYDALAGIEYIHKELNVPLSQIRIFFSGSKGIHLIVPYQTLNIQPHENLNLVYRVIAEDMNEKVCKYGTLDLAIYDKKRLFRLPNSINGKTGLYKIPLTYDELKSASWDDIKEWAESPRVIKHEEPRMVYQAMGVMKKYMDKMYEKMAKRKKVAENAKPLDFTPPCIAYLLSNPTAEGGRNNTCAALVSFFKQRGLDEGQAWANIVKWNDERCDPPMDHRSLETTFNSVYYREYEYGCSQLKLIAPCDEDNCPIGQAAKRKRGRIK